jgi:acyl carrier protein
MAMSTPENTPEITQEIIRSAVADLAQAPVPEDPTASLFEAGVIDSFAVMDLVAALEEAFGIQVPDADLVPRRFESLAKIAAYVDAKRGA